MALASGRTVLHRLPLLPTLAYSSISPSRISRVPCLSPPVPRFQICGVYSESKLKEITRPKEEQSSITWKIKMLYDGECPLCMREVNMLRERNQAYGRIKFVDISSDDYSPEENEGLDYKTLMGKIHAVQSDGTIYTNIDSYYQR